MFHVKHILAFYYKYIVIWSGPEGSSHVNPCLCALFYWVIVMNEKYLKILIKLAQKASKQNEVPISAIIVKNNKIIAKAINKREKNHIVLDHAEIIAIKKASKELKSWRLFECDLYVTLKPCNICENVIKQARIKNVYYLLDKPESKKECNKTKFKKMNICTYEQTYSKILSDFFQKKRDKK